MNIKNVKLEGSSLPWRLSQDKLADALQNLPVHIKGTKDLSLQACVGGAGRVRITPVQGRITEFSLHAIRNLQIFPEHGEVYVLFKYRGVSYEIETVPPYAFLPNLNIKKKLLRGR